MNDKYNECDYINADIDNASSMLRECVNKGNKLGWPCKGNPVFKGIDNTVLLQKYTERPSGDNLPKGQKLAFTTLNEDKLNSIEPVKQSDNEIEGFTNMGERYIPNGQCPDGYRRCLKTGTCKQICMNCKYRDNMKSMEFNEYDRCFPKHGVYAGITNSGLTKCTCGRNNQYCGDMYTPDGNLFSNKKIVLSIGGNINNISNLAAY